MVGLEIDAGRGTLYFALCWTVYVLVKAAYEAYKHHTEPFAGCVDDDKEQHKRVHIIYLIGVVAVCFGQLFGYLWFDMKNTGLGYDDRTIGVFNILFINLLMLFLINHFKAERVGKPENGSWKEILKF